MFPRRLPNLVADQLYVRVQQLFANWRNAPVGEEFADRMVDAVLRFLARPDQQKLTAKMTSREYARYAKKLLNKFWIKNARKQYARIAAQLTAGKRLAQRSLDEIGEDQIFLVQPEHDDELTGGETGRSILQALTALGYEPVKAYAFVWRGLGLEWDDIQSLLATKLGIVTTTAQLRQWNTRHFPKIRACLQREFELVD